MGKRGIEEMENKDWNGSDKNVGSIEEDIKILEDYIELIKKGYCEDCNELCNIYGTPTYPAKKISKALEHLIKAYKELEEKIRQFYNGEIYTAKQLKQLEENQNKYFINKEVIKEKLEELREQYKIALEENSIKAFILKCQIEILEKLLEGK